MKFKNVEFIEDMIMDCCEGNDSEGNWNYLNDEYGDKDCIEDWSIEWYRGYKSLFKYLGKYGYLDYSSGDCKFRFELENELIKFIFVNMDELDRMNELGLR